MAGTVACNVVAARARRVQLHAADPVPQRAVRRSRVSRVAASRRSAATRIVGAFLDPTRPDRRRCATSSSSSSSPSRSRTCSSGSAASSARSCRSTSRATCATRCTRTCSGCRSASSRARRPGRSSRASSTTRSRRSRSSPRLVTQSLQNVAHGRRDDRHAARDLVAPHAASRSSSRRCSIAPAAAAAPQAAQGASSPRATSTAR